MDELDIKELRQEIKEINNLISACICILAEEETESGNCLIIQNRVLAREILSDQISIKIEMLDVCLWKKLRNKESQ